ncbi:MAG: nucleotidyltransferase family protein [Candidatus Eremiobacteraeota bacterium]|nr:nucleotidyltransferase family protein [Candidatus Eremiobacteraeota bacterium]
MHAVITAGGRVDGAMQTAMGTPVKALARVRGRTMLEAAIDAARGAGARSVTVIGGDEIRSGNFDLDRLIDEAPSGRENVLNALDAWDGKEPLLYLTSDMPYVTPSALITFVTRVPPDTVAMAVAEEIDFLRRFPNPPAHGVRLGNEYVTNGGAFLLPAGSRDAVRALATRFFEARKSLFQMALLLGPGLLFRFLIRRLTIADLENHALNVLGIPARAIRGCAPELAYDIDTLPEYEYAIRQA